MKMPVGAKKVAAFTIGLALTTLCGEAASGKMEVRTPNLTGNWTWAGTTESGIPPFLAEMIGLIPEGEVTYLTCEDSGEMELVQTGNIVSGSGTQSLTCFTDGGQGPFWPPAFPPFFAITNGVVSGKSASFTLGTCSMTVKVVGNGKKLRGEGECPIPLPSPYFLNLVDWTAER
jgi:hypothetical protein